MRVTDIKIPMLPTNKTYNNQDKHEKTQTTKPNKTKPQFSHLLARKQVGSILAENHGAQSLHGA